MNEGRKGGKKERNIEKRKKERTDRPTDDQSAEAIKRKNKKYIFVYCVRILLNQFVGNVWTAQ